MFCQDAAFAFVLVFLCLFLLIVVLAHCAPFTVGCCIPYCLGILVSGVCQLQSPAVAVAMTYDN